MHARGTPRTIKSVIWVRVDKNGTEPDPCLAYSVSLRAQYIVFRLIIEIMEVGIRQGQSRPQSSRSQEASVWSLKEFSGLMRDRC